MTKYVYRFGQILVLSTLFLPLFIDDSFVFPFITPRNFLFRLLMSLGLGVIILLWLNLKELRPKLNWLNLAVIALLASKFLSAIFGVNFYNSFWSSYERMEGVLGWLFFGIFYFLVLTVFRERNDWKWLYRVSLLPAIIVALYGIGQAWGWDLVMAARQSRIEAQLGNAAYVGAYMVIHIGIAWYIILKDKVIWWRLAATFGILLYHAALFYSATRGAGVGYLIGIGLGLVVYLIVGKKKKLRLGIAGALAVFLLLVAGIWFGRDTALVKNVEFLERMTTIRVTEGTVKSRLYIWQMAWEGFKERPIFGWGQDNFYYIFNSHYTPDAIEEWVDRAHNNLLDQLSMGGAVNFISYLAVIAFPFYAFWRWRREEAELTALFIGLWAAYVLQNQFVFDSLNTYLYFFIFLAFAWFAARQSQPHEEAIAAGSMRAVYSDSYNRWIAAGLLLLVFIINAIFSYPGFRANRLIIQALMEAQRSPQTSLELFQEALAINSFGNKELGLQLTQFANQLLNRSDVDDAFKTKVVLFTIDALEQVRQREPDDVRVLLSLASMYQTAKVLDANFLNKAEDVLKRALAIGPKRLSVYFNLAQVMYFKNDLAAAEGYLRQTVEIDPDNHQALVNYISILNTLNDPRALEYVQILLEKSGDNLNQSEVALLAAVYLQNEKWPEAILVLTELTTANPDNANYWKQLGQAYQASGDTTGLLKVQQELERLDAAPLTLPQALPVE